MAALEQVQSAPAYIFPTESSPMMELAISPPNDLEEKIASQVIGQPKATAELAKLLVKLYSGLRYGSRPIDSIFLSGPSGVSKTESVLSLAAIMAGIDKQVENPLDRIVKVDGGSCQQGHEIASLTGPPPGYLGFDTSNGAFHPESLKTKRIEYVDWSGTNRTVLFILVDEVEKANEKLHLFMLSILDKGRVTMGDNAVSKFNDAVIFFTSNLGNAEMEAEAHGFVPTAKHGGKAFGKDYVRKFPPEYRGRINKTIVFEPLAEEHLANILRMNLQTLSMRMLCLLKMTPAAIGRLVKSPNVKSEGARAIVKFVEGPVQDSLLLATRKGKLPQQLTIDVGDDMKPRFFVSAAGASI